MARPANKDPLDKFRWKVSISGFSSRLGFYSCETPSVRINTQDYAEGGMHLFPKKIVDSAEYTPVAFSRGVLAGDVDFLAWMSSVIASTTGQSYKTQQAANNTLADQAIALTDGKYRRTVVIEHLDRVGRVAKKYTLYNAFPIEYKPASDFVSDQDDAVSVERIVLTYESFEVEDFTNSRSILQVGSQAIRNLF